MSDFNEVRQKLFKGMMVMAFIMISIITIGYLTTRKIRHQAQQTQIELLMEMRNDIKELKEKQCQHQNEPK